MKEVDVFLQATKSYQHGSLFYEFVYLYDSVPMFCIILILGSVVFSWGKIAAENISPVVSYTKFKQLAAYQFFSVGFWLLLIYLEEFMHWRLSISLYLLAFLALVPNVVTFFLMIFHWGGFQRIQAPLFRDEKRRMALLCVISGSIYSIFIHDLLRLDMIRLGRSNSFLMDLLILNYFGLQAYWLFLWQVSVKKTKRLLQRYQNPRITVI